MEPGPERLVGFSVREYSRQREQHGHSKNAQRTAVWVWLDCGVEGEGVRLEKRPRPGGNGEPLKGLNGTVSWSGKGGGWVGGGGAGGRETIWEATEVVA